MDSPAATSVSVVHGACDEPSILGEMRCYIKRIACGYDVVWGRVTAEYPGFVVLQMYAPYCPRLIEGVPEAEVLVDGKPSEWRRLPKSPLDTLAQKQTVSTAPLKANCGWQHNGVVYAPIESNPTIFHLECEWGEGAYKGMYRWRYNDTSPIPAYVSISRQEVYADSADAWAKIEAYNKEVMALAAMTDMEFNQYQVMHVLDRGRQLLGWNEAEYEKAKSFLMAQIEDKPIDARLTSHGVEWKYQGNKKWFALDM